VYRRGVTPSPIRAARPDEVARILEVEDLAGERFAEAGLPTTWPPPWDPGDAPTPALGAEAGTSEPFLACAPESEAQE
jgi:hypothetical protein